MRSSSQEDGTVVMQRTGDEAMECPVLDHPEHNRKERPKPNNNSNIPRKESRRPRLDHLGRIKQQEPPQAGPDHPGISGGLTPGTGSSRAEREGAPTTPRTRSSGQDRLGRIKQEEPPPPGLDCPGESGGQKPRRHQAKAEVVQRGSHVWMQRKGLCHGDAVI